MATMKISAGPRYQKTGSSSQKKERKLAEIMTFIIEDALISARRKRHQQTATKRTQNKGV